MLLTNKKGHKRGNSCKERGGIHRFAVALIPPRSITIMAELTFGVSMRSQAAIRCYSNNGGSN